MTPPLEIRVTAGILGIGAVLFVALALARADGALQFPVIVAALALLVVPLLLKRIRFARPVGLTVIILIALAHILIALGPLPWWARTASGVLAAAHVYAAILLLTAPARRYFDGVPDDE